MEEVVIIDALRTPIGKFGGALKEVSASELVEQLIRRLLSKYDGIDTEIDEVIIGNVLSSGQGQNIARQASVRAGVSITTPAYCVNKVCGSGMQAVTLATQAIQLKQADIVIAGGSESMSQAPYLIPQARWGKVYGNTPLVDSIVHDGLTDAFENVLMGKTAELLATEYQVSRQLQDEYALLSQKKAQKAIEQSHFENEIVPITVQQAKKEVQVEQDESVRFDSSSEKLGKLRPTFDADGTVTAGNASPLNDGAAVVLLMSRKKAEELGLTPMASIVSYASSGIDPMHMGLGPVQATEKALQKASLSLQEIELIELNEAFAVQSLCVIDQLHLDKERVNVNGGAIALGHPLGASGARIIVTLVHEMQRSQKIYGLATLCIGGGQGMAMIIKNEQVEEL